MILKVSVLSLTISIAYFYYSLLFLYTINTVNYYYYYYYCFCFCYSSIDGILAMSILCSAARRDPKVLRFVQGLSIGSNILETLKTENKSQEDETKKEEEEGETFKDTDHSSLVSGPETNVATLNVLGMQPKFIEPEMEESDSEEKTIEEEEEDDDYNDYNEVSVHTLSVCTQALIDNESIPDTIQPSSTELSGSNVRERGGDEEMVTTSLEEPSTYKDSYSSYLLHLSSQYDQIMDDNKTSNVSGLLSVRKAEREGGDKRVTLMGTLSCGEEEEEEGEEDNASSVGTSINRINLLDDRFQFVKTREEGAKAKSVTLTLPQIPLRTDSRCTHYTHSTAPFSWGAGVLGSIAPESTVYQHSILSTPSTIKTDLSTISLTDFTSWSLDVKLTFVTGLTDVVMYGRDSRLQEQALMRGGGGKEGKGPAGYSLIDLAAYNDEEPPGKNNYNYIYSHVHSILVFLTLFSCNLIVIM